MEWTEISLIFPTALYTPFFQFDPKPMLNPSDLENFEPDLLKSLLEPLLEDFYDWFNRSQTFLETQPLSFLSPSEQAELLRKVTKSLQEVSVAKALFAATDCKAGVDTKLVMEWHQLVTRCWQVTIQASRE